MRFVFIFVRDEQTVTLTHYNLPALRSLHGLLVLLRRQRSSFFLEVPLVDATVHSLFD